MQVWGLPIEAGDEISGGGVATLLCVVIVLTLGAASVWMTMSGGGT
jgi:hypothetical protein